MDPFDLLLNLTETSPPVWNGNAFLYPMENGLMLRGWIKRTENAAVERFSFVSPVTWVSVDDNLPFE